MRTHPLLGLAQDGVEIIDATHKPKRRIVEHTCRDQGPRTVGASPTDANKPAATHVIGTRSLGQNQAAQKTSSATAMTINQGLRL